jgi:radical SAM superfamily enzyme YgiQ (UPF0313 family)
MEHLIKDYRIEGIYFHDNNFLASRSHAEAVCRNMIRKGLNKKIKWVIQASAKDVNAEVLELLAEAGCVKIEMGIESIKNSELKNLHKNSDTGINEKALLLCRKHKIGVHAYFMTGFEDESQEDLNNMVRWIKKFRPHTFSLSKIRVLPGTELYEREGNRYFEENAWSRENIEDYFLKTRKGSLEQEEFKSWSKTVYAPFTNRYHKFAAFKVNSPASLLKMAYFRNKKQLF